MQYKMTHQIRALVAVGAGVLLLAVPAQASAIIVHEGWDLLNTGAGTVFNGIPLQGVPLGNYNFGSGNVPVGSTDTIVQRLEPVLTSPDTIQFQLVALQLKTAVPVDLGAGPGYYYITLSSGTPSLGTMEITGSGPGGGTFDTHNFDVYFDVRYGSLTGPIVTSSSVTLGSSGTSWGRTPTGPVVIDGVNHNLNGSNSDEDFWVIGVLSETGLNAAHILVPVPEPSTFLAGFLLTGLMGGSMVMRRFRRNAAPIADRS